MENLTNIYIDVVTGHLHKNLNSLFQVESNYILLERENIQLKEYITNLQGQIEINSKIQNINESLTHEKTVLEEKMANKQKELNDLLNRNIELETEKNALINKASHIDTFAQEINNYQRDLKTKDLVIKESQKRLSELEKELKELKAEKQNIPISIPETPKKKNKIWPIH